MTGRNSSQYLSQGLAVSGIAGGDSDLRTQTGQFVAEVGRAGSTKPAAAEQEQTAGTAGGEPTGHTRAQRTSPPGNQHRPLPFRLPGPHQ